jgi:hypothetical protein
LEWCTRVLDWPVPVLACHKGFRLGSQRAENRDSSCIIHSSRPSPHGTPTAAAARITFTFDCRRKARITATSRANRWPGRGMKRLTGISLISCRPLFHLSNSHQRVTADLLPTPQFTGDQPLKHGPKCVGPWRAWSPGFGLARLEAWILSNNNHVVPFSNFGLETTGVETRKSLLRLLRSRRTVLFCTYML